MRRFSNLYGPYDTDDTPGIHIANAIVDILGPSSLAANVVIAHAFVDGNAGLITHLLECAHVPLTLYHLRIGTKVSHIKLFSGLYPPLTYGLDSL